VLAGFLLLLLLLRSGEGSWQEQRHWLQPGWSAEQGVNVFSRDYVIPFLDYVIAADSNCRHWQRRF
jgi:hypothetical protein